MSEAIPTATLLDRLEERIDRRRVLAALFTSFEFQPDFFEAHILPVLFDQAFSNVQRIQKVQLEEALTAGPPIAVYYDARRVLLAGGEAGGPGLDFRKIPVLRKGYFHPKVFVLLLEKAATEDEPSERSLLVGVGSANLTRRGWWENVEAVWIDEIGRGQKVRYKEDLEAFLVQLRKEGRLGANHEALEAALAFLRREVEPFGFRVWSGRFEPRLFFGQPPYDGFADFLGTELQLPAGTFNLEILSPYFDPTGAGPLADLIDRLEPKEVRLLEPQPEEQGAVASAPFLGALEELGNGAWWGQLPDEIRRWGRAGSEGGKHRFVHAKVYRLWSQSERREILAVGSINLTRAAHGRLGAGNLEAAVLFEEPEAATRKLQFWLREVEEPPAPLEGVQVEPDEAPAPKVALRYDWARHAAEYYWLGAESAPEAFEVLGTTPAPLARVAHANPGDWRALEADRERIEECLQGSTILRVRVGSEETEVLVAEEGLAYRPSFVLSLTAEEILRYWSLLTPDQREWAIGSKLASETGGHEHSVPQARASGPTESLFDRFSGIFHAFARLEEHVEKALAEGRTREAEARLLGARYDSLPALVEKVFRGSSAEESAAEPPDQAEIVNRYVTLLTARQLVGKVLEKKNRTTRVFVEGHRAELEAFFDRLSDLDELEAQLELGDEAERRKFLAWFGPLFLTEAVAPEER